MMDEDETSTMEGSTEDMTESDVQPTNDNAVKQYSTKIQDRLSIRQKSKLDTIRDTIPRPKGTLPPTAMPTWHCMPLDAKIPSLPGSAFFRFTRGQIGDGLCRPGSYFDTSDPRRIIGISYTSLHDPNAKLFLNKPSVKSLLRKQGLVNEFDEVVCSQKEFNEFRSFLASQYNHQLKDILQHQDIQAKVDREQLQKIKAFERNNESEEVLNECLALLLGESEYLEDYIEINRKKITARKRKPSNVVDWRKDYFYRPATTNKNRPSFRA